MIGLVHSVTVTRFKAVYRLKQFNEVFLSFCTTRSNKFIPSCELLLRVDMTRHCIYFQLAFKFLELGRYTS